MAFESRHRWVLEKISSAFSLSSKVVEHFLMKHFEELRNFFSANPKRLKLFVFYQPVGQATESSLFFSTGEDVRLRGNACYFMRTGKTNVAVNTGIASDDTVFFGELTQEPLRDLESIVRHVYMPTFETQADWGSAEKTELSDFKSNITSFVSTVQDNIENLVGGLELRKPDAGSETETRTKNIDAELVQYYEEILESWCDDIESFLNSKQSNVDNADAGPMTELEWWKQRMQHLSNVIEQLKAKEMKSVVTVLSSWSKSQQHDSSNRQRLFALLRRWKHVEIVITESSNEAKDNVKYLFTLEKFLEPLYKGSPSSVIDTLPALMNSIKMIHTIARYYNTNERMTNLFVKITSQMIVCCRKHILGGQLDKDSSTLWDTDAKSLCDKLDICLKLNDSYQEHYRLTKDKLLTMPKGKQFDFSESAIFGKLEMFCRRITKLMDMFSTIQQFRTLASHKLEGMEDLLSTFDELASQFRGKGHDLLDYNNGKFDRDYVEFNVGIANLERSLQSFINDSFESITSITHSLNLLKKFQTILQRESLRNDLDNKFTLIFQTYGLELQQVQALYEKHKHNPPIPRNIPPVAGNIMWSRHLLKRIEEPMKKFESNQHVLNTKEARRIIKTYNKVARTLVAFEYLWYQAWVQSIETAKAGLQATLIIRHPEDKKLYVNFDSEILQLIREAKCLDRMGIEIPESAKIVLLQEEKFKSYYSDLVYAIREYERIQRRILPVTRDLLRPHLDDMEYKLRPGMITLTWTSMNIDAYKHHIHAGLRRLEEVIINVNDIIENRIEENLRVVSHCSLVDIPKNESLSLEEFVSMQEKNIEQSSGMLQGKNLEIENAVEDVIRVISAYILDPHIDPVSQDEVERLRSHYNAYMYRAILNCTKESLNTIKKRVGSRGSTGFLFVERPFFELDVQLAVPTVQLSPNLSEIQRSINKAASAIIRCSNSLYEWGQADKDEADRVTFYERVTSDIEIVRTVLLLTGSIQGTKNQVADYLKGFRAYDWLWKDDKEVQYHKFVKKNPSILEFELELRKFVDVEQNIASIAPMHNIGALSLSTCNLKLQLKHECSQWKVLYSEKLLGEARDRISALTEYIESTTKRLSREITDLNSLRATMDELKRLREKEAGIEMEITPILDMYRMLDTYLPQGFMSKEEMNGRSTLRQRWTKLVDFAEDVTDDLSTLQANFRRKLVKDVQSFYVDVIQFRADYLSNGPMAAGTTPTNAVQLLVKYKQEYEIRERKYEHYCSGEELFALKRTEYPELVATKREIELLDQLYALYTDVINTNERWQDVLWQDAKRDIENMIKSVSVFRSRCEDMPENLRDWQAYSDLRDKIKSLEMLLPLLKHLSMECIKTRHWGQVMKLCGTSFNVDGLELRLKTLLSAGLEKHNENIMSIIDSAKRELAIETKLNDIKDRWGLQNFEFGAWRERQAPILKNVLPIVEDLEEAQTTIQTMLTLQHVGPFRVEAENKLKELSDTSDTLEQWMKVQTLWCSMEAVFTGGDIMRQMPLEAKKFNKINKEWGKVMSKSVKISNVIACCSSEILRSCLPVMFSELERCQKSLEEYLNEKRSKFSRFYFVSNPVLLQILSHSTDAKALQAYYEKVFDAVNTIGYDDESKPKYITSVAHSVSGESESVKLMNPVSIKGNIETWLATLLETKKQTVGKLCSRAHALSSEATTENLREIIDNLPSQFALLLLRMKWTTQCEAAIGRGDKKIVKDIKAVAQEAHDLLIKMASWTEDVDSVMARRKIEMMISLQVHQRDIVNELASLQRQKQLTDVQDFEWTKRMRTYYHLEDDIDEDEDEEESSKTQHDKNGKCVVSIAETSFEYQNEFLGCKERLVVTPLTDRCRVAIAQTFSMFQCSAPTGPAGTGKTETVKDLGRHLGHYVVVTNCTEQMRYSHCERIFRGLCTSGAWGCFDEFNRISSSVLSVIGHQMQAIMDAKASHESSTLSFPGDKKLTTVHDMCSIFVTMNPDYACRNELPENLKSLLRPMAMIKPDSEAIAKVKLCSNGFSDFVGLARKICALYEFCDSQLSIQPHYDFGLRSICSALEMMGHEKRGNKDEPEEHLTSRTLRDVIVPKLVKEDIKIFLYLLRDIFPEQDDLDNRSLSSKYQGAVKTVMSERNLYADKTWTSKIDELQNTLRIRHGVMVSGPPGCGKSALIETLMLASEIVEESNHKIVRLNPKSFTSAEMYGETDEKTGEWKTGVFSAIWSKANHRSNRFKTWVVLDGPVDSFWAENLNSVLDDNKILTLANGDRVALSENCKLLFENDSLHNASPATVSRVGIVHMAAEDVDWWPLILSYSQNNEDTGKVFESLFSKYVGKGVGHLFEFISRDLSESMRTSRVAKISIMIKLLSHLMSQADLSENAETMELEIEKVFLFSLAWSVGGLLGPDSRIKFDSYLRQIDGDAGIMPERNAEDETIFDFYVNMQSMDWENWAENPIAAPEDGYDGVFDGTMLIPSIEFARSSYMLNCFVSQGVPALILGESGVGKTSTIRMFAQDSVRDSETPLTFRHMSFSDATSVNGLRSFVTAQLDKRGGKRYGPPAGKSLLMFLDDVAMPRRNEFGDQPALEFLRSAIESGGHYFLDTDKRGDFKVVEDMRWIAAMCSPGRGHNDIPDRLKRHFYTLRLDTPSLETMQQIFKSTMDARFPLKDVGQDVVSTIEKLRTATIRLWQDLKSKILSSPSNPRYGFNMRDLSRAIEGFKMLPVSVLKNGGTFGVNSSSLTLTALWAHESERVFCDKLSGTQDKTTYVEIATSVATEVFGSNVTKSLGPSLSNYFFCNFMGEEKEDEETGELVSVSTAYEPCNDVKLVKQRVEDVLSEYNEETPSESMNLVFFDYATQHLLRLNRILSMPGGSTLLTGPSGVGKRSLARLASYIAGHSLVRFLRDDESRPCFLDVVRKVFRKALKKNVTLLLCDEDFENEADFEILNSLLSSTEIVGLFERDQIRSMCADIHSDFKRDFPERNDDSENLRSYLFRVARSQIHVVLCVSPGKDQDKERFVSLTEKYPAFLSGTMMNRFEAWPESALIDISESIVTTNSSSEESKEEAKKEESNKALCTQIAAIHSACESFSDSYAKKRHKSAASVTPTSFISFLKCFNQMYATKCAELNEKDRRINLGMQKMSKGALDVDVMKTELEKLTETLEQSKKATNEMIAKLQEKSLETKRQGDVMERFRDKCDRDVIRIKKERESCEADLAKAMPFVRKAEEAIQAISTDDITVIKRLTTPAAIIQLVFDCVCIIFMRPLDIVKETKHTIAKEEITFLQTSHASASHLISSASFLKNLLNFGTTRKDEINEETMELLEPYLNLKHFDPAVAKKASSAAEGLCKWVHSMKEYYDSSKLAKPKLDALAISEAELEAAQRELSDAKSKFQHLKVLLNELQSNFEMAMAKKQALVDRSASTAQRIQQASQLIEGLSSERERWQAEAGMFEEKKKTLMGDCVLASAFLSYAGPLDYESRMKLIEDQIVQSLESSGVPFTKGLNVVEFLVNREKVSNWTLNGLASDALSVQNAILVCTPSSNNSPPILIDPEGQALRWLLEMEKENLPKWGTSTSGDPKLKDQLEFNLSEGRTMIVTNVETQRLDPVLLSLLRNRIVRKGDANYVNLNGSMCACHEKFKLYFVTEESRPGLSADVLNQTRIVDFTVTSKALEDQLLADVVSKEQNVLETQMRRCSDQIASDTSSLSRLENELLERLTQGEGHLLEDASLVSILSETKSAVANVKQKLGAAKQTRKSLREKREIYRVVATRGAVLYSTIVSCSTLHSTYRTSINQFMRIFIKSLERAEKASLIPKRAENIVQCLTRDVVRHVCRGMFQNHRVAFLFLLAMNIMNKKEIAKNTFDLFLELGSDLDIDTVPKKPFVWITDDQWLRCNALADSVPHFKVLRDMIRNNEVEWRKWCNDDTPETRPVPDYEASLSSGDDAVMGSFARLMIVRALRPDRTVVTIARFVSTVICTDESFVTDQISNSGACASFQEMCEEMGANAPALCVSSRGSDDVRELVSKNAKRLRRNFSSVCIGESSNVSEAIENAVAEGSWLLLQNCELASEQVMRQLGDVVSKIDENSPFRVFLSTLDTSKVTIPLTLLQVCVRYACEAPSGLRSGMLRSFGTNVIDQECLDRVDSSKWRKLLHALAFLHSIVQERRNFGTLGWSSSYAFNSGDLQSSISFLEHELFDKENLSWNALKFMISETLYGGKITSSMDKRLIQTYATLLIGEQCLGADFTYNPPQPVIPVKFEYELKDHMELDSYVSYTSSLPRLDSPELFGLHPNANVSVQSSKLESMLRDLKLVQRRGPSAYLKDTERIVESAFARASELLEKLPPKFDKSELNDKLKKLGGVEIPMNAFLIQEIRSLERVLGKVRNESLALQSAVKGSMEIRDSLFDAINDLSANILPKSWSSSGSVGVCLSSWLRHVLKCHEQLQSWLLDGAPNSYWLKGFKNVKGFFAAVKQEVARQSSKKGSDASMNSLEKLRLHTEITGFDSVERLTSAPSGGGVYVHGLTLHGARWNNGALDEAAANVLSDTMPVMFVTAMNEESLMKSRRDTFGPRGPFVCPMYVSSDRSEESMVATVSLTSKSRPPEHWILRGTALVCE